MMSSALFYLRCVGLIPYSLIYVCLCFLSCVEHLVRNCFPCMPSNDSGLPSSKMHAKIAKMLDVPGTCQRIWNSRLLIQIFRPSILREQDSVHKHYREKGDEELNEMKEEMEECKAMLGLLRHKRLGHLKARQTEEFLLVLQQSQHLQSHLDDLKRNIEERRFSSQTRAVVEKTNYHGFVDWAEKLSRTHENVLQATAQVGFVGAGLTYGSIFSSSRGNIGLMSYAFALFVCGFIIPTVALALLKWASLRPRDTLFTTPHTWTLALYISIYVSIAAVGSAICLLNLTLYLLSSPFDSSIGLQLDVSPGPAGAVSLGGLLLAVVLASFCVGRHYMARGRDAFIQATIGSEHV